MNKRLFRSRHEKVIGGVCGGIAEYYDVDPTLVRLATILLVLGLGFPVVAYLVAWVIIPRRPLVSVVNRETNPADSEERYPPKPYPGPESMGATQATAEQASAAPIPECTKQSPPTGMSAMLPGIVMVALGLFALLKGYFWWHWDDLVPVGLVVIGLYLIMRHLDLSITKKNGDANNSNSETASSSRLSTNGGDS